VVGESSRGEECCFCCFTCVGYIEAGALLAQVPIALSLSLSLSLSVCVCALPCRPTLGWWLADGREWCCDGSSVGALLRESKWGEGGERRSQLIFTPVEKPSICLLVFQAATIVPPTPD
jgi:hypothetical protein